MEEVKEVKEVKEVSAEEKQEERKLEVVPSKKRPGKKIIGIVGGVVAGVAAIGYGIYKIVSKKGESSEEDFEVIDYPCEEAEDGDYTEVSD